MRRKQYVDIPDDRLKVGWTDQELVCCVTSRQLINLFEALFPNSFKIQPALHIIEPTPCALNQRGMKIFLGQKISHNEWLHPGRDLSILRTLRMETVSKDANTV